MPVPGPPSAGILASGRLPTGSVSGRGRTRRRRVSWQGTRPTSRRDGAGQRSSNGRAPGTSPSRPVRDRSRTTPVTRSNSVWSARGGVRPCDGRPRARPRTSPRSPPSGSGRGLRPSRSRRPAGIRHPDRPPPRPRARRGDRELARDRPLQPEPHGSAHRTLDEPAVGKASSAADRRTLAPSIPASRAISSSSARVMPEGSGADGSARWSSLARLRIRPISFSPYRRSDVGRFIAIRCSPARRCGRWSGRPGRRATRPPRTGSAPPAPAAPRARYAPVGSTR